MRRGFGCVFISLIMFFCFLSPGGAEETNTVTLLFTHDMHSHIAPFTNLKQGASVTVGGLARMQSFINAQRKTADALLVDAGDFSMGTVYHTLFATHASDLRLLGQMGYDAVTLGNHEFDFGPQGITNMLNTAALSGDPLPQMLFAANDLDYLSDAMAAIGAKETMLIEKNGVKIGLFSNFGKDSAVYAPTMGITVPDTITHAKKAVKDLKAQGAELIICLSHSGVTSKPETSEDEQLAAAVPEIDVIVSGHQHTLFVTPLMVGQTAIVSCGEYGQYLGRMVLAKEGSRWTVQEYGLLSIDENIAEDPAIAAQVAGYAELIEKEYLVHFNNMTINQVLAQNPNDPLPFDVFQKHGESMIGNLIADAYRAAGSNEKPVDVAVIPAGYIRWGLLSKDITLSDVFEVVSLGSGPDELAGYPLIDLYLTGKELWNVAQVDASITPLMAEAQLFCSGLGYEFNPNRIIFNRVTDAWLIGPSKERIEIEKDKLYRLVVGNNAAVMLGSIKEKSFGIISIIPKDENGMPITDFDSRILRDEKGSEIKEWFAVVQYLQSFPKGADGLPQMPVTYSSPDGRKVVSSEKGIQLYFTHLNGFTIALYGIVLVFMGLVAWVARLIVKKRKRRIK